MIAIETKQPQVYNARENKFGKIVLTMDYEKLDDRLKVKITDFIEGGKSDNEKYLIQINAKEIEIPNTVIDSLFSMVNSQIPPDTPYLQRETELMRIAFLVFVQNDFIKDANGETIPGKTIYKLNPDDWQIRQ